MKRLVISAALCLVAASCASEAGEPQPISGFITALEGNVLTLVTEAGQTYTMEIADTQITYEHLLVHMNDKLPVTVTPDPVGDKLLARNIVDASPQTPPPGGSVPTVPGG